MPRADASLAPVPTSIAREAVSCFTVTRPVPVVWTEEAEAISRLLVASVTLPALPTMLPTIEMPVPDPAAVPVIEIGAEPEDDTAAPPNPVTPIATPSPLTPPVPAIVIAPAADCTPLPAPRIRTPVPCPPLPPPPKPVTLIADVPVEEMTPGPAPKLFSVTPILLNELPVPPAVPITVIVPDPEDVTVELLIEMPMLVSPGVPPLPVIPIVPVPEVWIVDRSTLTPTLLPPTAVPPPPVSAMLPPCASTVTEVSEVSVRPTPFVALPVPCSVMLPTLASTFAPIVIGPVEVIDTLPFDAIVTAPVVVSAPVLVTVTFAPVWLMPETVSAPVLAKVNSPPPVLVALSVPTAFPTEKFWPPVELVVNVPVVLTEPAPLSPIVPAEVKPTDPLPALTAPVIAIELPETLALPTVNPPRVVAPALVVSNPELVPLTASVWPVAVRVVAPVLLSTAVVPAAFVSWVVPPVSVTVPLSALLLVSVIAFVPALKPEVPLTVRVVAPFWVSAPPVLVVEMLPAVIAPRARPPLACVIATAPVALIVPAVWAKLLVIVNPVPVVTAPPVWL